MNKKKILIISRSFYPHNSPRAFRTTELVREFSRQGHSVTVLTQAEINKKAHEDFAKRYGVTIKGYGPYFLKRITLGKNSYLNLLKRILSRSLSLLLQYPDIQLVYLLNRTLRKEKGYDLLISIATPHTTHWGTALALKKNNDLAKTWIADCGDPFMGATTDSFKKLFYFKYVEKWWCRKADYITVPFEGAKEGYYPEFRDKIRVIPQGFDFNELLIDSKAYSPHKIPTFAYSGLLIPGSRDPRPLIDYLLKSEKDFKFILYNEQEQMFADIIQKAGEKVDFREYIARDLLLKELSTMDFLVNFNNKVATQLPSKLIDYYLTGRPILSLDSFTFDTEVVDQFLTGNYSGQYRIEDPEQYRIENVCKQFLDLS